MVSLVISSVASLCMCKTSLTLVLVQKRERKGAFRFLSVIFVCFEEIIKLVENAWLTSDVRPPS